MTDAVLEGIEQNDYWSIVLRQLRKSWLGLAGLGVVFALYLVAVFAPFLAESKPIRYVHSNPEDKRCAVCKDLGDARQVLTLKDGRTLEGKVLKSDPEGVTFAHHPDARQERFPREGGFPKIDFTPKRHGPIVNYPLLRSLEKVDLWLLLSFACLVLGTPAFLFFRRRGRPRKNSFMLTMTLLSPLIAATVVLIYTRKEGKAKMELGDAQLLFEALRRGERLGPGDRAVWPPVQFAPTSIDKRVPPVSKPPFMKKTPDEVDRAVQYAEGGDWNAHAGRHLLGADDSRRDILSRIIHGSRISLSVGFFAVGIYVTIGVILGSLAGYFGGWVDTVIMRVIEIVMCFPTLFLIITILALVPSSIFWVMGAIAIVGWTTVARLVRAEFLKLRKQDFVSSARALGARDFRIIFRHILPNALSPVFVSATFGIAGAILTESGLSFLGIGVPVDAPTWGNLLREGRAVLSQSPGDWWLALFPGLAIFFTVTSFNLFGESLRDAMDPRLKGGH